MDFCVQLYYKTGAKIKNRDAVNNGITKAKHKDETVDNPSCAETKKNVLYKKKNASQQLTRVNNKL